jgi:hypothetical protein
LEAIKMIEVVDWESIRSMIEAWAYPGRVNVKISPETSHTMRFFADRMLRDIVSLAKDRPGVLHWISQIAEHLDVEVEIPLDPAFETLYPVEDVEDWKAAEEQQISAVRELANVWSKLNPVRVIERIVSIEHEAQSTGVTWPRWTPLLCLELARDTMSPNAWIRAMIDADAAGDLVAPFLRRAAEVEEPGWVELALACLERPTLRWVTISLVLTLFDPPENLLAGVLQEMDGYAQLVEILCLRNEIPEHLVGRLLRHEDAAIANAAAQGEWRAGPQRTVRDSLRSDWREVVKNSVVNDYWFSEILKSDPLLAYDWLQNRISKESFELYRYERAVKAAVSTLDVDARRRILRQIPATYEFEELVDYLIGGNLDLYRDLLSDERLQPFHLVPLSGYPEGVWVEKARLALDAGYSIEEVAYVVRHFPHMELAWVGKESDLWADWIERFDRLCSHEDERIRKVGEAGRVAVEERRDRALKQERNEAIYGRGWR